MLQIQDLYWKKSNTNQIQPFLKLKDLKSNQVSNLLLGKDIVEFKYSLSKEKYCVGYHNGNNFKSCLGGDNSQLQNKFDTQCLRCEQEQGFKSAFFFGEEPNQNMSNYLKQKHYIYLAYFAPGIIKVGTVSEKRDTVRLIEQDAIIFGYIAENDGFNIQKLERQISKRLGITESVRSNHKFKFMNYKLDAEKAKEELTSSFYKILHEFKGSEFSDWFLNKNDFKINYFENSKEIYYPQDEVTLISESQFERIDSIPLVGLYKGFRGRYLIVENHSNDFAFDTRFIIGRKVQYLEDYKYNRVEQIKLF